MYELYVRLFFLAPPKQLHRYHSLVVEQVRAERQATHLKKLAPLLNPEELEIVRRGRNATTKSPKRLSLAMYQQATGFEALIGYLYLTNPERLSELFEQISLIAAE